MSAPSLCCGSEAEHFIRTLSSQLKTYQTSEKFNRWRLHERNNQEFSQMDKRRPAFTFVEFVSGGESDAAAECHFSRRPRKGEKDEVAVSMVV